MSSNIELVKMYIQNQILSKPDTHISDDDDLLLSGILDSISVMKLVAYIENEFKITVPAEDVVLEHFGSLTVIDQYINTRTSA